MNKYRGVIFLEHKNGFTKEIVYRTKFYPPDSNQLLGKLLEKHKVLAKRNPYVVYSWAIEIRDTETNLQQYQIDTTYPTNRNWLSDQPWEIKEKRNG